MNELLQKEIILFQLDSGDCYLCKICKKYFSSKRKIFYVHQYLNRHHIIEDNTRCVCCDWDQTIPALIRNIYNNLGKEELTEYFQKILETYAPIYELYFHPRKMIEFRIKEEFK